MCRREVSYADWCFESNCVRIYDECGILPQTMGERRSQYKYLQPEEALFLLDRCVLKLHVLQEQGVTVLDTLQDGFLHILAHSNKFSLNYFAVYGYLKRLGFVVKRHSKILYQQLQQQQKDIENDGSATQIKNVNRRRNKKDECAILPVLEVVKHDQVDQNNNNNSSNCLHFLKNSILEDHLEELNAKNGEIVNVKKLMETLSSVIASNKSKCVRESSSSVSEYLVYDVWKTNNYEKSSKKQQNRPSFAVVVTNIMENIHVPLEVIAEIQESIKPTPVYIAAVNATSVSFLNIEANFELPLNL